MNLYPYQEQFVNSGIVRLKRHGIVYFALEMRLGKTIISLTTASRMDCKRVLFVTKKKAISSINKDYKNSGLHFDELKVVNYESPELTETADWDCVIIDEAHSLGKFPKPAERTKKLREICGSKFLILLSGTPSPESYSQLFHQFWISKNSPWFHYRNFYEWAKRFVKVEQRMINGMSFNVYSNAKKDEVLSQVKHLFVKGTQQEVGFKQHEVNEEIVTVRASERIKMLISDLIENRVAEITPDKIITAETPVKLMGKIHQLCGGTVIAENRNGDEIREILDYAKADYIKTLTGKTVVFYKYQSEGDLLKKSLVNFTEDPETFSKMQEGVFISQIRSGAMGVDLRTGDRIVFYSIDFSSVLYWQGRARIQNMERTEPVRVIWLFMDYGIELDIYKRVIDKKDYTLEYFKANIGSKNSGKLPALFKAEENLHRQNSNSQHSGNTGCVAGGWREVHSR